MAEQSRVRTITKADLASICNVLGVEAKEVASIRIEARDVYVTFATGIMDGEFIFRTLHLPVTG